RRAGADRAQELRRDEAAITAAPLSKPVHARSGGPYLSTSEREWASRRLWAITQRRRFPASGVADYPEQAHGRPALGSTFCRSTRFRLLRHVRVVHSFGERIGRQRFKKAQVISR